jgi:hypothetical protein
MVEAFVVDLGVFHPIKPTTLHRIEPLAFGYRLVPEFMPPLAP